MRHQRPRRLSPVLTPGQERDRVTDRLLLVMEDRIDQNEWRRHAACIDYPKWVFYPHRGQTAILEMAKGICASCPVTEECLADNLWERYGVWGGLSDQQRRDLRVRLTSTLRWVRAWLVS